MTGIWHVIQNASETRFQPYRGTFNVELLKGLPCS